MTTETTDAPLSVYDYVRSLPATEKVYADSEDILTRTIAQCPFADPSVGTDEHGRKLYPQAFLAVATIVASIAVESLLEDRKGNNDEAVA